MSLQRFFIFCIALLMVGSFTTEIYAQPGGRGGRGERGGGRGGRGGWGGGRGGGGWGGGFLKRLDKNNDGTIQQNELDDRSRRFVEGMARNSGIDTKKDINIGKLTKALEKQRNNWRGRGQNNQTTYKPENNKPLTVQGFGVEDAYPTVPGFDVPLSVTEGGALTDSQINAMYGPRVLEYVYQNILNANDKNKNGVLDPEEWGTVSWRNDPNADDLNKDGRLTKIELVKRIAKRWGVKPKKLEETRATKKSSATVSVLTPSQNRKSFPSKSSNLAFKPSKSSSGNKALNYAKGMMKKYDKNGDGAVFGDELKGASGLFRKNDLNGDGIITLDEIVNKQNGATSAPSNFTSSNEMGRGNRRGRNSYGSKSSSFTSKDKDEDGQIAMAEFSTTWNDRKVKEFQKLDKNGDGVITQEEYTKR